MSRTLYYKAALTTLRGPHYGRGQAPYLPGTEHEVPLVDEDPEVSCGVGLYYTSHRRVAARWAPVVMTVRVQGKQVRSMATVRPANMPRSVNAGTYRKYRTDNMLISEIIGIVGYARDGGEFESRRAATARLGELNDTLAKEASDLRYRLTGRTLEVLRDQGYRLWELERVTKPTIDRYYVQANFYVNWRGGATEQEVRERIFEALRGLAVYDGSRIITVTKQEA